LPRWLDVSAAQIILACFLSGMEAPLDPDAGPRSRTVAPLK
jgi:hypothetical protein